MNTNTDHLIDNLGQTLGSGADRLASQADQALQDTKRMAHEAADKVAGGVDQLRSKLPGTLTQAAAQAEELAHRGAERARELAASARARANEMRDMTAERVQSDPMKAVLVAAAAGAATALLVQWLARPRHTH